MKYNSQKFGVILILLLGIFTISCNKDESMDPVKETSVDPASKQATNEWIQSVMDEVYYWVTDIGTPVAITSDPKDYFESLLFRPTDRFSVIYEDYQKLINNLNGISLEAGYEFQLYKESESNDNVYAEILYIKKNSPASQANLKRGDIISKINGTQIDTNNFRDLLSQTDKTHTVTPLRYNPESDVFESIEEKTITPIELSEDPNFLDSIYTVGDQKIGYVVYNFFAPGTKEDAKKYDNEMDAVFAKLKAANINNLILDFRYNGGGYVTSAVNLASLIGPGVTTSDLFSKTRYNNILASEVPSLSNVKTAFLNKEENIGSTLQGNRLYILTSRGTASASELIINGLKPYMDVFLIGDVTYGKNVGSIALEDEENKANKYGLLPIVTRSFNSLDESEYSTGFQPNLKVIENTERLRALGDVNEVMLRNAIEQITGIPSSARVTKFDRVILTNTLERKVRTGKMIEEPLKF